MPRRLIEGEGHFRTREVERHAVPLQRLSQNPPRRGVSDAESFDLRGTRSGEARPHEAARLIKEGPRIRDVGNRYWRAIRK